MARIDIYAAHSGFQPEFIRRRRAGMTVGGVMLEGTERPTEGPPQEGASQGGVSAFKLRFWLLTFEF